MANPFGGIFCLNNPGRGGSCERRFPWSRTTPFQLFAQVDRLLTALTGPGLVALNTIELDVEAGRFPEVLTAYFADEGWDYQHRWMVGAICKDDRADTYRHGRFTFEARPGLTGRLLAVDEGVRWGAALRLGGVMVQESDVAAAIRQSPFDAAPAETLEALSRSAWAATKDLDGLAVWVPRGQPDIVHRIRGVLETD